MTKGRTTIWWHIIISLSPIISSNTFYCHWINVREYIWGNQTWTIQRNWQHRIHKTKGQWHLWRHDFSAKSSLFHSQISWMNVRPQLSWKGRLSLDEEKNICCTNRSNILKKKWKFCFIEYLFFVSRSCVNVHICKKIFKKQFPCMAGAAVVMIVW
jgi:hypothetical protein